MTTFPPYRLHASLGYQLTVTARSHERQLDEGLRALGLSRVRWCVLLAVGNERLRQPSEIARFVGIDRTATSRALSVMEKDGMIARRGGQQDKRTTTVALTETGAALLREATPLAMASAARMAQRLTPVELQQLSGLLAKARADDALPLQSL